MSTRRERAKAPVSQSNKQLADAEDYLYAIGIFGFLLLMWIGNMYYNKGIKEK